MTAIPTTSMTAFINGIVATLKAHSWPSEITDIGFREQAALEEQDPETIDTPALLLNLTTRENAADAVAFPGVHPRLCAFELYCLLSQRTQNLPVELIELTEAACALIERRDLSAAAPSGNRWGLAAAVEYPRNLTDFESNLILPGIAARVVTWEQIVYLPALEPAITI